MTLTMRSRALATWREAKRRYDELLPHAVEDTLGPFTSAEIRGAWDALTDAHAKLLDAYRL